MDYHTLFTDSWCSVGVGREGRRREGGTKGERARERMGRVGERGGEGGGESVGKAG